MAVPKTLLPILFLAVALRLLQINEPLWLDELHTSWVVADGVGEIAQRAAQGNQSSLYYYVTWLFVTVLGEAEWVLRLPALICGVLAVAAVFTFVQCTTTSGMAAWFAALLVAFDRNGLFYSGEARPYAAVMLLGVVHLGILYSLCKNPTTWRRIGFVAIGALLFYTHYTAGLLFAGELAFLIKRDRPTALKARLVDFGWLALTLLPALPQLWEIGGRRDNWSAFVPELKLPDLTKIVTILPLGTYVLVPLAGVATIVGMRRTRGADSFVARPNWLFTRLLVSTLLVPLALAWILTYTDVARVFFLRYVIVTASIPPLLAGLIFSCCRQPRELVTVALLTLASLLWSSGYLYQVAHAERLIPDRQEDWRGAVAYVNERYADQPGPVFIEAGLIESQDTAKQSRDDWRYYGAFPVSGIYRVAAPEEDIYPVDKDSRLPADASGGWLVVRTSDERRVEQIAQRLRTGNIQLISKRAFGNVWVARLQEREPSADD